jgi:hypothetical protein
MDEKKIDVCALAQNNIDAALDAPVKVIAATIPMQISEFMGALTDARSFQILFTDAGLFLLAWRNDNSFAVFDINRTATPVKL